eukprot:GEMP01037755.1.p1 GENE.GEMP01037755.1~~GEMP01037755.1.p1  ORF type:complete len:410 (+),score=88.88 GEMP01037755.1:257-1486(+)
MRLSPMIFSVVARYVSTIVGNTAAATTARYATKTAYRSSMAPWGRPLEVIVHPSSIVHVDVLIRHGSRYPKSAQIIKWQETAQMLVPAYKPQMKPENGLLLSPSGWRELEELGSQWRALTQHLPAPSYSASTKSRAMASAEAFITGFHNRTRKFHTMNQSVRGKEIHTKGYVDVADGRIFGDNATLRFFDYDKRYMKEVEHNPTSLKERDAFERNSVEMHGVASELSAKLHTNVSMKQAAALCSLTGSEIALFNSSSLSYLWTPATLDVLNYVTDLKHFYKSGRGHIASVLQARPYVRKLLERIEERDGQHYAFGHAETLIPVLELIAPAQGSWPTAHNFRSHVQRAFDTSNISPFAGNLAFVLYKDDKDEQLKVVLALNGHVYGATYELESFKTLLVQLLRDPEDDEL